VGSNVKLDFPVAGTDRFAVNECVRLLGMNRYLQFPGLKVLCEGGYAK